MAESYSLKRVFCADYLNRHKKKIEYQRNFRNVKDLDIALLKKHMPEAAHSIRDADVLCQNCFNRFKKLAKESPETSEPDEIFLPQEAAVEDLNRFIQSTEISPLKARTELKSHCRKPYAKRKKREIESALVKKISSGLTAAYGLMNEPGASVQSCNICPELISNLRYAFDSSDSYQERCRLLTLLPRNLSKQQIQKMIPSATRHLIQKARKNQETLGVWSMPDPYTRARLSQEDVQAALDYYTKDELNCSQQSPNKKDVIGIISKGQKEYVSKRFMTRSIRETFRLFKAAHPDTAIGLTKFYSLRPKWVQYTSWHEVCVCTYCANIKLSVCALEKASGIIRSAEDIRELTICDIPSTKCFLGQCSACPTAETLTAPGLGVPDDDEVLYATWEKGELIRKEVSPVTFVEHLRECLRKWVRHEYIRREQGKTISEAKQFLEKGNVLLHFDFAENWTVVLPEEVQSYHWQKTQISIFTCVVTTRKGTRSCALISDDTSHDSAHACYAVAKIHEWLEDVAPLYAHVTYVSDGAASHFKNRYQLHELTKTKYLSVKWLFSATGHGKNACDGIGGLVKHHATLFNLRGPATSAIKCASDMVDLLKTKLPNVALIHLPRPDVQVFRKMKSRDWDSVRPVPGIQSWHFWQCTRVDPQRHELLVSRTRASTKKPLRI